MTRAFVPPSTPGQLSKTRQRTGKLEHRYVDAGVTISYCRRTEFSGGADVSVPAETNVNVPLNTVEVNTDTSIFNTSTSNAIKVLRDGLYSIKAQTNWSVYKTEFRSVWVIVNSDYTGCDGGSADDFNDFPQAAGDVILAANDVLKLYVHQPGRLITPPSGSADSLYVNEASDHNFANFLEVRFLGGI